MIIWGRKKVTKELGRVADFCPICRKLSAFKFIRIGMVGHIYYIPLGEGSMVANEIECEFCKTKFLSDATNYQLISTNKEAALDQLIYDTNPNIRQKYSVRLLAEEKVRTGEIDREERINLIREALILGSSGDVSSQQVNTNSGVIVGFIIFIISIISMFALPAMSSVFPTAAFFSCFVTAIIGFVIVIVSSKKIVNQRASSKLVSSLRPLKPSFTELDETIEFLKSAGHNSMQYLNTNQICEAIESNE